MSGKIKKPYISIPLLDICNFQPNPHPTDAGLASPQKVYEILDKANQAGINSVRFSGGEPFLYPHLQQIMQYAADLGFEIQLNTNGLLLAKHLSWLQKFQDISIKVNLKPDYYNNEQGVTQIRQRDKIINSLRQGVKAGLVKRVNFVRTPNNTNYIVDILALCQELGIGLKIFDMYPIAAAKQTLANSPVSEMWGAVGGNHNKQNATYTQSLKLRHKRYVNQNRGMV